MEYHLTLPLSNETLTMLRAGDTVYLSGAIYTARDAAHARLDALLSAGEPLPLPPGCCIYYAGPCPAAPGEIVGPCGPTTSKRMDKFTPALIRYGIKSFIGKGPRSPEVTAALAGQGVYFAATGGAGMLYASCVTACRLIAFGELGPEAIYEMTVQEFPVLVATDAYGQDLYQQTTLTTQLLGGC